MNRSVVFKLITSIILIAMIAWAISCAVNPVTKKREFMLLTEADEIALGKETDAQITQTYGLYDNPELLAYVNALGQNMAKLSHRPNLSYTFRVLDSPVINAFAVPGGYIYLTRGILGYINDEAELAGVVGHELGHVNARHTAQQYSRAQLAQLGLGIGAALSETFRKYAGLAQFGVGMLFLRFSRDNERQADTLGVEYSTKASYDANHMANLFVTLGRLNPGSDMSGLPGWFSTHPNPPDRIASIKRYTQEWQKKVSQQRFAINRDNFLSKVDGIVFGEDPRQGYVDGNMFYHPQLKFQFPVPAGWQVNNTPTQVQMFTQKQDAVIIFSMASENNPAAAADKFIANTNAVVKQSDPMRINGLIAQRVISDITTDQAVLGVVSYFIQKENTVYAFYGYTAQNQFNTYASVFNNTMTQFNRLSDPAKINVQPARLKINKTTTQMTLRNALQQFRVPQDKMEEMAILNGMKLDDVVPTNSMIKVVMK